MGRKATAWLAGIMLASMCASAAPPDKLTGSIVGWVANQAGLPQMGATVLLFNGLDRLTQRALTDEAGGFLFDALAPGSYSLRVSLASFLPAQKRSIQVQPGTRSLFTVNLAGVLSSIELVYSASGTGAIMNEDWKWVLRSGSATRPVLRFSPRVTVADAGGMKGRAASMFSGTHGVVSISASDQSQFSQYGSEADLGTAFALATSLFGDNQVRVSGNLGYSSASGIPTAGFRTSFRRGSAGTSSPRVNLTMRQLNLPARAGIGLVTGGAGGATPALRTMSVGFLDDVTLGENLHAQYGFSLESVSFFQTLNYFSPYGRLTYSLGDDAAVELAFNSGVPPAEMFAGREFSGEFQHDLAALSLFPRVSLRDGRARVQRSQNIEVAARKTIGSRTYNAAVYREFVTNGTLTMTGGAGVLPAADLLPDLASNSAVFNAGSYSSVGYMLSVTQQLNGSMNLTFAGGSGNALIPSSQYLSGGDAEALRKLLLHGQRRWLAMRFAATVPGSRTQFATTYRWADGRSLTAPHLYLTQSLRTDIGWNATFRQPMPDFYPGGGRLEMTADLRNLFAQGYLPLNTSQGRRILLLHTPRSVRGGFNFIF